MTFHNRAMSYIGGVIIGAMMLLVVGEVLNRLVTGRSIEGTIEIVSIFLAMAIFLGFSPCEEADRHVKVELVVRLLPQKAKSAIAIIVYILAIGIVAISSWKIGFEALESWSIRERLPGADVLVPIYPAKIVCFIGYVAFLFHLTVNLISKLRRKQGSKE